MKYGRQRCGINGNVSPSMRREWIEICPKGEKHGDIQRSPSMRREWIEMRRASCRLHLRRSLPPCGGSGLKYRFRIAGHCAVGLPPCGGSGLKLCAVIMYAHSYRESPSMRREWIEIPSRRTVLVCPPVSLHAEGVD